jgi:hypothetical protein
MSVCGSGSDGPIKTTVLPGSLLLPDSDFAPVSRAALQGWCAAFAAFLVYAALNTDGFLFLDNANLMVHEAGHLMFGWAGYYTQILGGTLGQLSVPLACMLFFIRRGETTAVAATMFWTFENLLYVATYMADARRSALPLVGGDESDWTILFSHWGVLQHDLTIAAWTRGMGWIGMLAATAWLVLMHARNGLPAIPERTT